MKPYKYRSTTEMKITSVRLEPELIDNLKELARSDGYQALIREVLWSYVQENLGRSKHSFSSSDITSIIPAIATTEKSCVLSGKRINKGEEFYLATTATSTLVPIHSDTIVEA